MELRPGQHVVVLLPSGGHAASVTASAPEALELVLVSPPQERLPIGQRVVLEATTTRGLVRRHGVVAAVDGRGGVRVESTGADEVNQRRGHARVTATLDVEVRPVQRPDAPERTLTRDVSAGGLLLAGPAALQAGESAWLTLALPDQLPPMELLAECVRTERDGARAVAFSVIGEADRERLVSFVFARQRHARLMAREQER